MAVDIFYTSSNWVTCLLLFKKHAPPFALNEDPYPNERPLPRTGRYFGMQGASQPLGVSPQRSLRLGEGGGGPFFVLLFFSWFLGLFRLALTLQKKDDPHQHHRVGGDGEEMGHKTTFIFTKNYTQRRKWKMNYLKTQHLVNPESRKGCVVRWPPPATTSGWAPASGRPLDFGPLDLSLSHSGPSSQTVIIKLLKGGHPPLTVFFPSE